MGLGKTATVLAVLAELLMNIDMQSYGASMEQPLSFPALARGIP